MKLWPFILEKTKAQALIAQAAELNQRHAIELDAVKTRERDEAFAARKKLSEAHAAELHALGASLREFLDSRVKIQWSRIDAQVYRIHFDFDARIFWQRPDERTREYIADEFARRVRHDILRARFAEPRSTFGGVS